MGPEDLDFGIDLNITRNILESTQENAQALVKTLKDNASTIGKATLMGVSATSAALEANNESSALLAGVLAATYTAGLIKGTSVLETAVEKVVKEKLISFAYDAARRFVQVDRNALNSPSQNNDSNNSPSDFDDSAHNNAPLNAEKKPTSVLRRKLKEISNLMDIPKWMKPKRKIEKSKRYSPG